MKYRSRLRNTILFSSFSPPFYPLLLSLLQSPSFPSFSSPYSPSFPSFSSLFSSCHLSSFLFPSFPSPHSLFCTSSSSISYPHSHFALPLCFSFSFPLPFFPIVSSSFNPFSFTSIFSFLCLPNFYCLFFISSFSHLLMVLCCDTNEYWELVMYTEACMFMQSIIQMPWFCEN